MLYEHTLLLVGLPFILFLAGSISKKSIPLITGGIGLLVVGVLILASPVAILQMDNSTLDYTYANVTQANNLSVYEWQLNQTTELYSYSENALPANDNMMFGFLISFVGLSGLVVGALTLRE